MHRPNSRLSEFKILALPVLALLAITGAFWLFFSVVLGEHFTPNGHLYEQPVTPGKVVLTAGRGGRYTAPGFVNGQRVSFVVDTGATAVAFSDEMADRLGLRYMARTQVGTAAGVTDAWLTRVDTLRIGGIVLHDVGAMIVPAYQGAHALLGMSALEGVRITQFDDRLILKRPVGRPQASP